MRAFKVGHHADGNSSSGGGDATGLWKEKEKESSSGGVSSSGVGEVIPSGSPRSGRQQGHPIQVEVSGHRVHSFQVESV